MREATAQCGLCGHALTVTTGTRPRERGNPATQAARKLENLCRKHGHEAVLGDVIVTEVGQ